MHSDKISEPSLGGSSKRRLRRVADASRKRSAQSCDFCRKRRCKCVPLTSGHGCVMCQSHGQVCCYNLPRKARFYGSVDDLSDRFRCLEAIVRGAFPDDDISNTPALVMLGERMGYAMPDLSEQDKTGHRNGDLIKPSSPSAAEVSIGIPGPVMETSTRISRERASLVFNVRNGTVAKSTGNGSGSTSIDDSLGLIRDTTGREHFIGPSGSLQFLGQLRKLLLIFRSGGDQGLNETRSSSQLTATFTEDDAAQALETDGNQSDTAELVSSDSITAAAETEENSHAKAQHTEGEPSPLSVTSAPAKDSASIHLADVESVLKQLPQRQDLDPLVRTYFKRVHPDFPLFHRGTFEEEYETFVSSGGRFAHPQQQSAIADPGWLACLHMMLAFSSLISEPKQSFSQSSHTIDFTALRHHCLSLTRYYLLPHLFSRCSLSNIRAILLLALYLHNHNERNAAWNLVGTAARASFAMGLHQSAGEAHFRPVEREVRKLVFCTLFAFEQFLASSLGRPSCFNGFGMNLSEDIQLVSPRAEVLYGATEADEDGAEEQALRLQVILAQARVSSAVKHSGLSFTEGSGTTVNPALSSQEHAAREILQLLRVWRTNVAKYRFLNIPFIIEPEIVICHVEGSIAEKEPEMPFEELKKMLSWQSRTALRNSLVLHMQYRYIAIMVTRTALLQAVVSARLETASRETRPSTPPLEKEEFQLSEVCVTNAIQLCYLILLADNFALINGISAMDVFYAYCGVMVLVLRTLQISGPTNSLNGHEHTRDIRHQQELRQLIARTREVLLRVDKCSTMKRFARVVATFEDASKPDSLPLSDVFNGTKQAEKAIGEVLGSRNNAEPSVQILPDLRNRLITPMPVVASAMQGELGSTFGTSSRMNNASAPGLNIRQPTSGPPCLEENQLGSGNGGLSMGLGVGNSVFWQPSLLTSFDGEPEVNSWMANTLMGEVDGTAVIDWGDIESTFTRNHA